MEATKVVTEIFLWVIVAAIVLAVLMNPSGFASAVSSIFGGLSGLGRTLSGSGYVKAA